MKKHLLFGRFLNFMHMGINPENTPNNLTERRFRSYSCELSRLAKTAHPDRGGSTEAMVMLGELLM